MIPPLSHRLSLVLRWLFLAILLAALVWGPSIIENILAHQPSPWRVALTKVVVFDTELYFQMLGGALEGFTYGKNISWFGWIIQGLGGLFPSASVSELWLVSRWLSLLLFFAVGPWCFRQMSQLPKRPSQLLFAGLWLGAFLPLSLRPGIYSWYIPFCFLGMVAVYRVFQHLEERRLLVSVGWTVAALFLTMIYPWFFIFTFLWVASLWAQWAIRSCSKWHYYFIILVALACAGSVAIASFSSTQPLLGIFQRLERSGLGYTHLPFVANTVVSIFPWLLILTVWNRLRPAIGVTQLAIPFLQGGWAVLLLCWFFSPFTGIVFQNDHFRTPILILSWISLSVLVQRSFTLAQTHKTASLSTPRFSYDRIIYGLLVGSTALPIAGMIYFVLKWIRTPGDNLIPLHISLWLTTSLGAWLTVIAYKHSFAATYVYRLVLLAVGVSCLSGLLGWGLIIRLGSITPSPDRVATAAWIRDHIPPETDICSTLKTGNFFSAYTARRIHPMHAMRYTTETDEEALRRLDLILGAHDAIGAGTLPEFELYALVDRFIPCEQYPWAKKLLSSIGTEGGRINDLMGCDERAILRHQARLRESAVRHQLEPDAFSAACPVVVFPSSQRIFWHLPEGYTEVFATDETRIWADKRLAF